MPTQFDRRSAINFLQVLGVVHTNHRPAPLLEVGSLKAHTLELQQPLPSNEYYLQQAAGQAVNDLADTPLKVPASGLFADGGT